MNQRVDRIRFSETPGSAPGRLASQQRESAASWPTRAPSTGSVWAAPGGACAADAGYDQARTVFYGSIDRRPAVIVRPADPGEVASVVALARETGLDARCQHHIRRAADGPDRGGDHGR